MCADKYNLIELDDLIGFGYDLSDIHELLMCWRMGFIFYGITSSPPDKDSGERSRAYGPSCLFVGCNYPPTKSEGYSFGVLRPSTLFVRPEPYLSTYWSDLIHSWYK